MKHQYSSLKVFLKKVLPFEHDGGRWWARTFKLDFYVLVKQHPLLFPMPLPRFSLFLPEVMLNQDRSGDDQCSGDFAG